MKYYAVKTSCVTLIPSIIEVDFKISNPNTEHVKDDYIYVIKGGVTGYESANVESIVNDYIEGSPFAHWCANFGTLNKYNKLDIPMSQVIKWLVDNGYIETEHKYGYLKKVRWLK